MRHATRIIGYPISPLDAKAHEERILVTLAGPASLVADADAIWNSPCLRDQGAGNSKPLGLRAAIERYAFGILAPSNNDVVDFVTIAVPFTHFALYVKTLPYDPHGLELNLLKAFREDFGRFALQPPRVQCFVSNEIEKDKLFIHFGYGIFVPKPNESPRGRLQIRPPEDDKWLDLLIPAFEQHSTQATGLYQGQTGVGFSFSPRHSLVYRTGLLDSSYRYFFGRIGRTPSPSRDTHLVTPDLLRIWGSQDMPLPKPAGPDSLTVHRAMDNKPLFHLRWVEDQSDDRLRHEAPKSPHFKLVGLIFPDCGRKTMVDEWWLDLDQRGRPTLSPLQGRARSLAGERGGRIRLFNHFMVDNEATGWVTPKHPMDISPELLDGGQALRISDLESHPWRYLVTAWSGFGYLGLRKGPIAINLALFSWLDDFCGVQMRRPDPHGKGQGFAALAFGSSSQARILLTLEDNRVRLRGAQPEHLAFMDPKTLKPSPAVQGAGDSFEVTAAPGEGIIVGCCYFMFQVPG